MSAGFTVIFLWLALIAAGCFALQATRPPPAAPTSIAPEQFSAARALQHLPAIARQPHPTGSEESQRVRDYLLDSLQQLGAEVRIEKSIGTYQPRRGAPRSAEVQNIVATCRGTAPSRTVLLVAHYDSVPGSPGAGDDGAGVVVLLETLRALQTGAPLRNEVVILFTDAEEAGLLGAAAFTSGHPDLAERVGVVINLEARGTSGPALMFETSDQNGWLIRQFARAAPNPTASSLMYAVYKLLPNDTDLTPLKAAGLSGFNFAFTESWQHYHTANDSIENLDPRSVQHMGANVLALTRQLGNLALTDTRRPDLIYFNPFGHWLLAYPMWLAQLLAPVALVVFAFCCFRAARFAGLSGSRIAAGAGSFFFLLFVVAGVALLSCSALRLALGGWPRGDMVSNRLLFAGFTAAGFAAGLRTLLFLEQRLQAGNLAAGLLLALSALLLLLTFLLPGGSYVLQVPVLFGMFSFLATLGSTRAATSAVSFAAAAVATVILFVPLGYLLFVALGLNLVSVSAAAFLLAVLLSVAAPFFVWIRRETPHLLAGLVVLATTLVCSGALLRLAG